MLNQNTIEFLRYLNSDPEIWKELTEIHRGDFDQLTQHEWENDLELLEEKLDYFATTDEYNPFPAEFMAQVDLDEIYNLIVDGHLLKNGKFLSLEQVLNPFKTKILEGKRINGQTEVGYQDPHAEEFFDTSKEPDLGKEEVLKVLEEAKLESEFDRACEASRELRSMNHGSVFDLIFK